MARRKKSAFAGARKRRPVAARGAISIPARWRRVPVMAAVISGLAAPCVPAAEKKPTAVKAVMDRQVRNAIDAGEGDLAVRALRVKVVEQPADVESRLALAAAYERDGAAELAIEHYRIAAFQYDSERAASRLARALDRLGESEQAVEVLVRYCGSHERASSSILSELGILEDEMSDLRAGEHYHALALTAALREGAAGQDQLHSNLGYNLIGQKRYAEAEAQLRTALELNPRSVVARGNLALALASSPSASGARIDEAILQWQSLSGPAAAHNNLAAVYMEQGRYPEARRELERAIGYDNVNAAAFKNLEALAALDGKPAEVAVAPVRVAAAKSNFLRRWFVRKTKQDASGAELAKVSSAKKLRRNPNSQ
jgi:tetratricopeptide (TPR) repeat protein